MASWWSILDSIRLNPLEASNRPSVYSHVILQRNRPLLVADDGKSELAARNLINVLDPASVALDCVCAQANELDTSLCKLWLELGERSELGGADRCVVFGVREEDDPAVANELVEVDGTVSCFGVEVGSSVAKTERHGAFGGAHVVDVFANKKVELMKGIGWMVCDVQ